MKHVTSTPDDDGGDDADIDANKGTNNIHSLLLLCFQEYRKYNIL